MDPDVVCRKFVSLSGADSLISRFHPMEKKDDSDSNDSMDVEVVDVGEYRLLCFFCMCVLVDAVFVDIYAVCRYCVYIMSVFVDVYAAFVYISCARRL